MIEWLGPAGRKKQANLEAYFKIPLQSQEEQKLVQPRRKSTTQRRSEFLRSHPEFLTIKKAHRAPVLTDDFQEFVAVGKLNDPVEYFTYHMPFGFQRFMERWFPWLLSDRYNTAQRMSVINAERRKLEPIFNS